MHCMFEELAIIMGSHERPGITGFVGLMPVFISTIYIYHRLGLQSVTDIPSSISPGISLWDGPACSTV